MGSARDEGAKRGSERGEGRMGTQGTGRSGVGLGLERWARYDMKEWVGLHIDGRTKDFLYKTRWEGV